MSKKTIYIAGLGLIGGSLALGIKRDHPDYEILGYNRSDYSRNIALERGIVDRATSDFKEFAPFADVIILAVPIKQTVAYLKELADLELKDDVIITDAGSTKLDIVEAAERYLTGKNVQFVGSHPMAGSHKSGAIAADVTLFENAYYIFTPTSLTRETTIPELKDILSGLKSRFVELDAAEHDRVTSQISHFPHLLASGLMEQAADYAQAHEMTLVIDNDVITLDKIEGRSIDMELVIRPKDKENAYKKFALRFAQNQRFHTELCFRPDESVLKIDRKFSGTERALVHQRRCLIHGDANELKLRVILDRFSVEIFINDGEQVMSAVLFTEQEAKGISFSAEGAAKIDVVKYDLV